MNSEILTADALMQLSLWPLMISLAIVLLAGKFVVGRIIDLATARFRTNSAGNRVWMDIPGGGTFLGLLEILSFFFAIILDAQLFIGAWLAFKVAAKWESWANIVQMKPLTSDDLHSIEFENRHRFGAWVMNRFLLGTMLNIMLAGLGAWIYLFIKKYCAL
jgi:hypothetical protein